MSRLGKLYEDLGDEEKALASYQQTLQIHQDIEDATGEGYTLEKIVFFMKNQKNKKRL